MDFGCCGGGRSGCGICRLDPQHNQLQEHVHKIMVAIRVSTLSQLGDGAARGGWDGGGAGSA